ncbi:MAG: sensor histidine kinase [Spirochaetales bacterium]|nr:sensor histidine kinase [Spirochaetales bacterium]
MRSILFVHSIINTVILFLSIIVWIGNRKRYPGTFGWMIGLLTAACGEILLMLRGIIPDFFTIVMSNTCLLSGYVIFYFGLRHFIENKVRGSFNIILICIFFALFNIFGLVSPDLFLRYIIFSVFIVIISSQFVWFLIKNASGKLKQTFIGLSALFSFYGIVYIVRIITTIVWPPHDDFYHSGMIENVYIIISQIVILIIGIFLVVIINKKLLSELQIYADENKILVKEIHHRVKNNLQMILSLLQLQSNRTDEIYIKEAFKTIRNRILSISFVHEKLYRENDLGNIELSYYLNSLIEGLIQTYDLSYSNIKFISQVPDFKLNIAVAVPIGLIVNELVTNSIKYAFPGKDFGTISVKFYKNSELYTLSVRDDGIGLPENFKLENNQSLGSQLLLTLVRQLDGSIEYNTNNGTHFKIFFRHEEFAENK